MIFVAESGGGVGRGVADDGREAVVRVWVESAEAGVDKYYRPSGVVEGAAIELNDYFTLGMTLGVPALACFLVYVGLAMKSPKSKVESRSRKTVQSPRSTVRSREK